MNFLLYSLLVSIGINLLMFVPAYIYNTDKITDISYAVTFAVVAISGYMRSGHTDVHKLLLLYVLLWSLRLGTFLFIRINKMKVDVRFNGIREHFLKFLQFWVLQGATVFVVMLAASLGFMQTTTKITFITVFGVALFFAGLVIEAFADAQKFKFNGIKANKGKFIDVGVWKASRHPNYLGEMMVWIGMYLVAFSSLTGSAVWWALVSPLYIILLLMYVSGVPLLEKSAEKRWGSHQDYKLYKSRVPVLIPTLSSIKRALK